MVPGDRFSFSEVVAKPGDHSIEVSLESWLHPRHMRYVCEEIRQLGQFGRGHGGGAPRLSPAAGRDRWRLWADESCRYVMAHNQFIAGDAFALEDLDPDMAAQNDLFSQRELQKQGYSMS